MPTAAQLERQLRGVRARFGAAEEIDKRRLLAALAVKPIPRARLLVAYHDDLLFLVAFPGAADVRRAASAELGQFGARVRALRAGQRAALANTGIVGTVCRYAIAHRVAERLVEDHPDAIELDWANMEDPVRFDELVAQVLTDIERESFESETSRRRWLSTARRADASSALQWLLRAGASGERADRDRFAADWDLAQVPVRWRVGDSPRSVTRNLIAVTQPRLRTEFRKVAGPLAQHVMRPLAQVERLERAQAARAIDVARSALAARCREVHAMNYANPDEVHLAELGDGVQLVVIGVLPSHRLLLEANYGYMLLANGVPIGYGGVSPLFRQANTGINVFDAFRGSEAAFVWAQTLRAFRSLFGVRRFIVNGYQFGAGNSEAIGSGAYWFYYRLGFRPAASESRRLAEREARRLRREGGRSSTATLHRLARGDLHFDLPDWDPADVFDESALDRVGTALARRLAGVPVWSRMQAAGVLAREVREVVRADPGRWSRDEQVAFQRLAPVAALLPALASWPAAERRALAALLRAKGAVAEQDFARRATKLPRFFRELARVLAAPAVRKGGAKE
jgi:hypothetical protein